jgi:uncharacterized protein (TIGR01244 family)
MARLYRRLKRAWRRMGRASRKGVSRYTPDWARRHLGGPASYLDMLLVDHGIFRMVYVNQHRLGDAAWRSAQPAPHHISRFARQGIRTIVNLRGEHSSGSFWLEERACARHGLKLVNFKIKSRESPTADEVKAAKQLFEDVEYPMLMHCKSGADRVGLMSVLYRHFRLGEPIATARKQLSLRYGHVRQANTGILDHFFDSYLEANAESPIDFLEWVDTVYRRGRVNRAFHSKGWANRLVDGVLKRE